jgi:ATP-binding cassette, subfamily B, multidrug efflux pump
MNQDHHLRLGKANDFKGALIKLFSYLRPHYSRIVIILTFAIFGTAFTILSPKILGKATTKIAEGVMARNDANPNISIDFEYIRYIILIIFILYVLSALFNYLQGFLMSGVVQKVSYQLRKEISIKINNLPLKYFDRVTHGDLLSRLTNDVDLVSSNFGSMFTSLATALITLLGILIMMFTISPTMALVAVLTVPISGIIISLVVSKSQKHFENHQKYLGEINGYVEEIYTAHDIVKAFGGEEKGVQQFNKLSDKLYEASWKSHFISGIMSPMINIITNIGYALVCILGGYYAVMRIIDIGDIQAFIQYLRQFNNPLKQISSTMSSIQAVAAASERIFEFLGETEEKEDIEETFIFEEIKGNVDFERVQFGYKHNELVIKNLSFKVKAGQKVAIVGPTGAGKTTLVNLLMRFYDVNVGSIKIDGIDIRNIKKKDLRSIFGMVLQDTWLFHGTIRENIAYGKLDASDDEILQASKASCVDDFINTIPEGYHKIIDEDGTNISTGQKQLITIARSFIANPAILILDEATSSVDTRTEILIQKAMDNLMRGRTCFIIAHRLSTIRDADVIMVINDGKLIEHGKHEELLAKNGFYASLYNSQFQSIKEVE